MTICHLCDDEVRKKNSLKDACVCRTDGLFRTDIVYLFLKMTGGVQMQGQTGSACGERSSLGSRIRSVLNLQPDAVAIEGAGGKSTWADLAAAVTHIDAMLRDAQV